MLFLASESLVPLSGRALPPPLSLCPSTLLSPTSYLYFMASVTQVCPMIILFNTLMTPALLFMALTALAFLGFVFLSGLLDP